VNGPKSSLPLRWLACCACLLAMPAQAVVLDFETLGDGITRAVALRSASAEYAALGVSFSGGGGAPGQPVFRGWNSLSSFIAKRPPPQNRFLLSTFQQYPGAYLDIVISFATPVSAAEGDVVFNPTVTASAIVYGTDGGLLDQECFASGSANWLAGHFSFASPEGIATILLRTGIPEAQIGLDNLAFTPVPEPTSLAALIGGIGCIALLARARSRPRGRVRAAQFTEKRRMTSGSGSKPRPGPCGTAIEPSTGTPSLP
jgi:hypothetical protein